MAQSKTKEKQNLLDHVNQITFLKVDFEQAKEELENEKKEKKELLEENMRLNTEMI